MEVRLLGPTEVRVDGERVGIGSIRQRTVLAALAAQLGTPVSADHLIDQLWPELQPPDAAANLQVHVSKLRTALRSAGAPAVIATESHGYVLADDVDVDLVRFEALVASGRDALGRGDAVDGARLLHQALSLWRGEVLADLDAPFVGALAARLDEMRAAALEDRIQADLDLGRHLSLTTELPTVIAEHPYRERLIGEYMLALYRCGRQADALDIYQEARRQLIDDLGLEPGPELRRLEEAILLQKPELDWRPPAAPTAADLMGRDRLLGDVVGALRAPGVVTLVGPGGVGKTSVARAIAASHPGPAPWFAVFDDHATTVIDAIAAAVGARQAQGEDQLDAVAGRVGEDPDSLLVLDNCEHLVDTVAATVADLVNQVPSLRVLVTSRQPLGLEGERVVDVPTLDEATAVEVFARRAAEAAPGFSVTDDNTAVVTAICNAVDRLPLAIELAAARMAVMNADELQGRVSDPLLWLRDEHAADRPDRHRSLRECIDWSYQLLPDEDRRAFAALSVFAGDFDVTEAEAVLGDADVVVADALARLARASLLVVIATPRSLRFRALESIREFAAEQLRDGAEEPAVRDRHLDWLASRVSELADGPVPDVDGLNTCQNQIWAALEWAVSAHDRHETMTRLVVQLAPWWTLRGAITEGRRWLDRLLACDQCDDNGDIARARLAAGSLAFAAADFAGAAAHFNAARDIAGADPAVVLRARFSLANVGHMTGSDVTAEMREIADAAAAADDDDLRLRVLNSVAVMARRAGDMDGAVAAGEDALRIARRVDNRLAVATILVTLGDIAVARQQVDVGRDRLSEALDIGREVGAHSVIAAALGSLAAIEPDPATAATLLEESLDATHAAGNQSATVVTLLNLGTAHERSGDNAQARRRYEEGRALAEQIGDPRGVAQACLELARLGRRTGAPWSHSAALALEALERRHAAGDLERTAEVLEVAGGLALDKDDTLRAAVLLAAGDRLRTETAGARDPLDSAEWEADVARLPDGLYPAREASILGADAAVAMAREVLMPNR